MQNLLIKIELCNYVKVLKTKYLIFIYSNYYQQYLEIKKLLLDCFLSFQKLFKKFLFQVSMQDARNLYNIGSKKELHKIENMNKSMCYNIFERMILYQLNLAKLI